jgi:hypothetical protein
VGAENQTQQANKTTPKQPQPQPGTPGLEGLIQGVNPAAALQKAQAAPPPALRTEDVLSLQRTGGNQAVQRLLADRARSGVTAPAVQRQGHDPGTGDKPVTGLDAGMLKASGGELQYSGNVTVTHSGDKVQVDSPPVSFDATVELKEGLKLEGEPSFIQAGPVQTMLGSERTGVYRRGGLPDGKIIAEKHITTGETRDAQYDPKDPSKPAVHEPWYSQPSLITDGNRQADVKFFDQPGFILPEKMSQGPEQGKLTETKGEDRFLLSLSAKRGDTLIHLESSNWEAPWDVDAAALKKGVGGEVTAASATNPVHTSEGPIALAASQEWSAFRSVEAAMGASAAELLQSLPMASVHDREAWGYMVEALRRKNPTLSITVTVEETAEIFSADDIQLTATGHKQVQQGPISINDKGSHTFSFGLTDVFDPAAIGPDAIINFQVQDVGVVSNEPATGSWRFPFPAQTENKRLPGGGGGKYFATTSMQ